MVQTGRALCLANMVEGAKLIGVVQMQQGKEEFCRQIEKTIKAEEVLINMVGKRK